METHSEQTDLGDMNILGNTEMAFKGRSFALDRRRYIPIVPITTLGPHMPITGGHAPVSPRTKPTDINT
jgi:hypothetical protein